jgi:hypothetical protein
MRTVEVCKETTGRGGPAVIEERRGPAVIDERRERVIVPER